MATSTVAVVEQTPTAAPVAAKATKGQIFDLILHDIITAGLVAASIFVKNPASQQHAANIVQAINPLIALLDSQLNSPATT